MVCRFTVGVSDDLSLLVNDEGTRSFLALKVDQGTPKLHKLVESVDDVLRKYRQPVYYQVSWARHSEGTGCMLSGS